MGCRSIAKANPAAEQIKARKPSGKVVVMALDLGDLASIHTFVTAFRRNYSSWDDDGFRFFAEKRVLRWLGEPRVQAKLDASERRALERLCQRLPEMLPAQPACLTHGDFWAQNILATADAEPAVIDPAVSYMWAEVDLSHVWCSPHPAEARRLFDVYGELTGREAGWLDRLPLLHLRQHMALIAMYDHDWGSTEAVRALVAPFRTQ